MMKRFIKAHFASFDPNGSTIRPREHEAHINNYSDFTSIIFY